MHDTINETPELNASLLIAGYYAMLGGGFVLGGVITAVTAVPHSWGMAQRDSLFLGGTITLALMALVGVLLGGWMVQCAVGLWAGQPKARRSAVLLSALMVMTCALAIPVLLFSYGPRDSELDMLLALSALIGVASGLSGAWLLRAR